jgi:uncharacterized protein (DUF58 family)
VSRLTPLSLSMLTLVAWSLVLAVVSGRAELVVAAVPLVLGLLRVARRAAPSSCSVTHEVSVSRAFEGERVRVTIGVATSPRAALVELFEPLPAAARVVSGGSWSLVAPGRDGTAEWTYEVACARRGALNLGTVHARLWDRAGLRAFEVDQRAPKAVRVHPRLLPVRRLPRPRRTQTSVGNYVARAVGEGLEPGDIRPFVHGDRVRHVNWRASLRFGSLHVTQYQQERNADVILLLDSLAETGEAPDTTLDASIRAAASLAAAYLERKDRVGYIEYGGLLRSVRPGSGRRHHERLVDTMLRAEVTFSYVTRDISLLPRRLLPAQALVIALSPLLERAFEKVLVDLAARGFDVVVVSPSPIALVRGSLASSRVTDLACRLWALERRGAADRLRRLGITIVDWDARQPLDIALDGVARPRRDRAVR